MLSHEVQRMFSYRPEQLFDIAADVECYPEYLPGFFAARIIKCEGDVYCTEQVVGFGVFRKRITTRTELWRPERITVTSTDRQFRNFEMSWRFDPLPGNQCRISLRVDLELRSRLAQDFFRRTITRLAEPIMSAFAARADRFHGSPAGVDPETGDGDPVGPAISGSD